MNIDAERTGDTKEMKDEDKKNLLLSSNFFKRAEYLLEPKPSVKRRLKALKKLQLEVAHIDEQYHKEVHVLECIYEKQYQPLFEKRKEIINGTYEPTDQEAAWHSEEEEDSLTNDLKNNVILKSSDTESTDVQNKAEAEEVQAEKDTSDKEVEKDDTKGIPDFWLTIFKNVRMLDEMVQEHDEPILKHLMDIKVILHDWGFVLEFQFEPNEFFSNSVLTKEYVINFDLDNSHPFSFDGPEIRHCKGCNILWKKGKNVTIKTIKKNQKHKSRGSMRTVTKTVQNDSFFNFFSPPEILENEVNVDSAVEALLVSDYEIGHYIRERIVPKAVLYYTGEVLEDEDYENEEEEDDEDEDDEADEEDEDSGEEVYEDSPSKTAAGEKRASIECNQQ
ncbi:nucleosome assembly protein 1-like 1 [Prorops nasuta]|uniref:nucleosome assembly protein 1-like 1 n=1 Tax=Prorops nasuta TaxID=863751 RepID=UPI0034CD412D